MYGLYWYTIAKRRLWTQSAKINYTYSRCGAIRMTENFVKRFHTWYNNNFKDKRGTWNTSWRYKASKNEVITRSRGPRKYYGHVCSTGANYGKTDKGKKKIRDSYHDFVVQYQFLRPNPDRNDQMSQRNMLYFDSILLQGRQNDPMIGILNEEMVM